MPRISHLTNEASEFQLLPPYRPPVPAIQASCIKPKMSRQAPQQDRTEANRTTLKSLVKLPANRVCADCKTQKHPRWASWNLGIFVCIRCSGIHRGMGTHISRVKSVDLDSWTDEQLAVMLRWGNRRANRYWEAKLKDNSGGQGHMPREEKIENFIRTKYESKRWVMDGPMPDPETLGGEEDDEVPLNIVQEKVKLERSASQKIQGSPARTASAQQQRHMPQVDLFGDEPPVRPSTGPPTNTATAPPPPKAQPKQPKPADSLLGLDFLGSAPAAAPARPSSTGGATNATQRTDLKQSILSLYASTPKAAPQPQQQQQQQPSGDLTGLQSPPLQSPTGQASSGLGGLNDAFSGLNFSSTSTAAPPQTVKQASPFDGLKGLTSPKAAPAPPQTTTSFGGGGSFFDPLPAKSPTTSKPPAPTQQPSAPQRAWSSSSGFGDFLSSTSPITPQTMASPVSTQNAGDQDLFGPAVDSTPAPAPTSKPLAPSQPNINSAFNLSNPPPPSQPVAQPKPASASLSTLSNNFDAWGSNDVWGSESNTTAAQPNITSPAASTARPTMNSGLNDFGGGWGSSSATTSSGWGSSSQTIKPTPEIAKDDDFGGWSTAPSPGANTANPPPASSKPFATNDDLFSNVWE